MPGGLWGVPGVVFGGLGGVPGGQEKRRRFSGGVLGWSWEPFGVVLEIWGDPWVSPGRSECCYFLRAGWTCYVFDVDQS